MTTHPAPPPAAQTCPDCSGSGIGGTRRHGPDPKQWEALRCERCDGEGRIAPPAAQTREPLLPCPLCASDEISFGMQNLGDLERHYVQCENCGCNTGARDSEADAIAAWNKRATPAERAAPMEKPMTFTDDQIRHMVNRFLGWRLPDPWHPDGGIEFKPEFNVEYMASQGKPPMRHEPTGTNLFDYKQSTAMVRYMVEGMERASDAALGERLRALRAKATPGPWSVATYCLRPGSPDQIERGLLMYGDDEGDDVSPTGVIDEKDMPGIGEESVSHDLDLIAELVNNLDAILAALTPSAPGSGTGWNEAIEAAARIAFNSCSVPPDGGSPTETEREMCEEISRAIRALRKPSPPGAALAALARVQAAAPGEREADPLDGLPIERENMLAERQRLLDRKFAGDMTSGEATRLAFVRYGLDVWEEATRTPSPEAAPGAEAKVRALDEALRKLESKWRREGENMVFSKHRRDAMKGCADALAALIGGDNG